MSKKGFTWFDFFDILGGCLITGFFLFAIGVAIYEGMK